MSAHHANDDTYGKALFPFFFFFIKVNYKTSDFLEPQGRSSLQVPEIINFSNINIPVTTE